MKVVPPVRWFACLAALLCLCGLGLGPDQIALVVNQSVPDSLKLARQYAAARGIPDGRIISLDVPSGNDIEFDRYETYVVPQIRAFLRDHHLDKKVRCLVTFYGVPFRIRDRTDTGAEKQELAGLRERLATALRQAAPVVQREETLARTLDPGFTPPPRVPQQAQIETFASRYRLANRAIATHLAAATQPAERQQYVTEMVASMALLGGNADLVDFAQPRGTPTSPDTAARLQRWQTLRDDVTQAAKELFVQEQSRFDPDARADVRRITSQYFGLIRLCEVLQSQIDYLTPGTTNAAFDNELALLWLSYYPRNGPWINPLRYSVTNPAAALTLMVSRLDAPDAPTVARMIDVSVQVEKQGLHGCLAINSYGYPNHLATNGQDEYAKYAMKFHDLGKLIRAAGNIPVVEEYTGYFSNHEVADTALYAGWYSVRHYRPGMSFSAGAVGYHIASFELLSLHEPTETGWVHGLLSDGVVATLGPVAEPYLLGFPPPDEFFPLLMTGKLTLAEVYWKTEPTASWMMCLIGDPLYTPYKTNPALKVEDLPPPLRAALAEPPENADSSSRPQ